MDKKLELKRKQAMKHRETFGKRLAVGVLFSTVLLGGLFLLDSQDIQASESDGKWAPRSIEQIKQDVAGKREYTIVWGDTLSGISLATNITMDKLASLNGIGDYNLIYAGNKLLFEGNTVTVQDQNGLIQDQQALTESDKLVPDQSIGEAVVPSTPNSNNQGQSMVEQQPHTNKTEPTTPDSTDNGASTNSGANNNETGTVTPTPTPEPTPAPNPEPTPEPEPKVRFTVWFYAYEEEDASSNIEKGTRFFATDAEATAFIENYADQVLMQGIAGSYGVMSWH